VNEVARNWERPAMVDLYQWRADAQTENGEHAIAYVADQLKERGVPVIPVIGYDRWGNEAYRLGLKNINPPDDGHYCLRLDHAAIDDSAEPDHFRDVIGDIVEEMDLNPGQCTVLIDFADISMGVASLDALTSQAIEIIRQLDEFQFGRYVVAGCSLPKTINLAVGRPDTVGTIMRKEFLVWKTLRLEFPELEIVSGDYGVRGPTTTEFPSKYTNGKIRHTIKNQMFIARGHAFTNDGSYEQMHGLSSLIAKSSHYLGDAYSWGDGQIFQCSRRSFKGSLGHWIAVDTNHHLTFVVQEVDEFERDLVTVSETV
jgi:hypothetical protein